MKSFEIGILIFLTALCIYGVVNRIISVIENILMTKYFYQAYSNYITNCAKDADSLGKFAEGIEKISEVRSIVDS